MFFMFIAVYIFRHIVPLLYIQIKLSRACSRVRLYLNVKQVEDSENIYGVLIVIVKDQQRQLLYK